MPRHPVSFTTEVCHPLTSTDTILVLERPQSRPRGFPTFLQALDRGTITAGAVGMLFATTGPLALLLTVARAGGLSNDEVIGWIFAGYAFGGVLSILFSAVYRQPIGLAWSIPGTAMLLAAVDHLSFPEIVGAYLVCGVIMTFLGLSGWIGWLTARVPVPVVMGMVAGVFLPIGLGMVTSFADAPIIAGATIAGFVVVAAVPPVAHRFPPMLGALFAGALAVGLTGGFSGGELTGDWIARPEIRAVSFSVAAMVELVPPLLISVIAIQNLQGFMVLGQAGHKPPVNALTVACGYGTLAMGAFGSVPACVTGPVNAILVGARPPASRWAGGIVFGVLIGLFGLFAPLTTAVASGLPLAFIAVLGGLAMLPVLNASFNAAFSGKAPMGALVAFLVTVSDVQIFNIGAAFWGLVFGYAVTMLLERPLRPSA
jgi:benzoate membrane transport protein